jgi:molybdopterin molybdotransferase
MAEFLKLTSVEHALNVLLGSLPEPALRSEEINTAQALGRVLAEDAFSNIHSPAFNRSSVDGFSVRARDTQGTSESIPSYLSIKGEVPMGALPSFTLAPGEAGLIHTGGMLPEGADAVVMLENSQVISNGMLEVHKSVAVNENVLLKGEDVRPGSLVIPAGRRIRPEEIGGLMALGRTRVRVNKQPVVHLVSSGDELVPPNQQPQPGQIRDINTHSLAALVEQFGGHAVLHPLLPDDPDLLESELRECLRTADLVVITAGSSASERDMTADVVNRIGVPGVLIHGVSVRPGKPTILARCGNTPVIGLPGNPVSALVIARLFVVPVLDRLSGLGEQRIKAQIPARLSSNLPSQAGRDDYIPVVLKVTTGGWVAEPIFFKSNLIFSMVRATGLVHVPSEVTGIPSGETVIVELL